MQLCHTSTKGFISYHFVLHSAAETWT